MQSFVSNVIFALLFLGAVTIVPSVYADIDAPSSTQAAPVLRLAENNIERNARCNGQRQACVSQCSVLPQVSACRQSCESQYQNCIKIKPIIE